MDWQDGLHDFRKSYKSQKSPHNLSAGTKCRRIKVQTKRNIVKSNDGEIKMETLSAEAAAQAGREGRRRFSI